MNACTGKCCAVFNYSATLPVLKDRAEQGDEESKFLVDMLVALTPEEAAERVERFDVALPDGHTLESWTQGHPAYTCRHWDEDTMLCGVYETRPKMCRDYPYAGKCQHDCACSFVAEPEIRANYGDPGDAYRL